MEASGETQETLVCLSGDSIPSLPGGQWTAASAYRTVSGNKFFSWLEFDGLVIACFLLGLV